MVLGGACPVDCASDRALSIGADPAASVPPLAAGDAEGAPAAAGSVERGALCIPPQLAKVNTPNASPIAPNAVTMALGRVRVSADFTDGPALERAD